MSSSKMSHHKTRKSSYSFSSSSKRPPTSLSVATGESHYEDAVERLSTDGLSGRDGLEQESLVEEISTMLPSSSSASGQQHAMTRGECRRDLRVTFLFSASRLAMPLLRLPPYSRLASCISVSHKPCVHLY